MGRFFPAALTACALVLSGCLTTNSFDAPRSTAAAQPLRGHPIYIYSFLDVREDHYGHTALKEIHGQLSAELKARGVETQLLKFRETPPGFNYAFGAPDESIPVGQAIESNRVGEQAFGTRYRLIIFPSYVGSYGSAQGYAITWTLVDVRTGAAVWSTRSSGSRTIWVNNDEGAEGRARQIVTGLMTAMVKSHLLEAR